MLEFILCLFSFALTVALFVVKVSDGDCFAFVLQKKKVNRLTSSPTNSVKPCLVSIVISSITAHDKFSKFKIAANLHE